MPNIQDNIRRLYDSGKQYYSLPDFATFQADMQDEAKRRRFYESMQKHYSLPAFEQFTTDIVASPTAEQPTQQQPIQPVASTVQGVENSVDNSPTWTPTPMQKMGIQMQMDDLTRRTQQTVEATKQQIEDFKNINPFTMQSSKPRVSFNQQTGKMETLYPSLDGNSYATPEQAAMANRRHQAAWQEQWETTTEEGKKHRAERLQREQQEKDAAFDAFVNGTSLMYHHDPDNAAERAWQAAEERTAADNERSAEQVYGGSSMLMGGREMHMVNAGDLAGRKMVNHLRNHDLDRLFNEAWENLGTDAQNDAIESAYLRLQERYPDADAETLRGAAAELARQQSDRRMYNLAVEKNLPKDNLEYLMRKIMQGNTVMQLAQGLARSTAGTTGDMAARQQADEQYRQDGHKVADVAGSVAGFALDPLTLLTMGVGSGAAKGTTWLGGKWLAGRGASSLAVDAATREFGTTTAGRILSGMAAGAGNFGTYEFAKEGLNQFEWGGHINPETGENEGYSFGEMAKAGGHGAMMGASVGWINPVAGSLSSRLAQATSSTAGKLGVRAAEFGGTVLTEGTIFSIPEWMEGKRDAFDVWTDNQAMMLGFKGQHLFKTGLGVLGDLAASREGRVGFDTRLRARLDGRPELALTTDERRELEQYGYGDLRELVEDKEIVDEMNENRAPSSSTTEIARQGEVQGDRPETISHLQEMLADSRISEAARAKMYYLATGRMLPMSTVTGGTIEQDGDGYIVNSYGVNGVITSRRHSTKQGAEAEMQRINRQMEFNYVAAGERFKESQIDAKHQSEVFKDVAENYDTYNLGIDPDGGFKHTDAETVARFYKAYKEIDPLDRTANEQQLVDAVEETMKATTERLKAERPEGIRVSVNQKYGVDIDKVLAKEPNRRSEKEQAALEEYVRRLYPEGAFDAKAEQPTDGDPTAPTGDNLPQIEEDTPYKRGHDADPDERRDIVLSMNHDPESEDAQESYRGMVDRIHADADAHIEKLRSDRQAMQFGDGSLRPATLKLDDKPVYIVSGNVQMFADGSMIDLHNSDDSIVVYNPESGKREMISPDALLSLGETMSSDEVDAMIDEQHDIFVRKAVDEANGTLQLIPGDVVNLQAENGEIVQGTLVANDGNGGCVVTLQDGTQLNVEARELQRVADEIALADWKQRKGIVDEPIVEDEATPQTIEGAPQEYEPDAELVIRDEDGQEKRGIVQGRVRYDAQTLQFIPDPDGQMIEYYVEGEGMKHDYPDRLSDKVVSYTPVEKSATEPQETEEGNISTEIIPETGNKEGEIIPPAEESAAPIEGKAEEKAPVEAENPVQVAETEEKRQSEEDAMPLTADEEPDYYATTPERAHSFIYNEAGLSRSEANEHVMANYEQAQKDLTKAKSAQMPKMGTSIKKFNEAKALRQQKIDDAENRVAYWQAVRDKQMQIAAAEQAERAAREAEQHDAAVAQVAAEREAAKQAEAERKAVGNENPMPAITEKWNTAVKTDGAADEIVLPNGKAVSGHYVLHESGASSPSHQATAGWKQTDGFPMDVNDNTVNDRDYEHDTEAQRVTQQIAQQYDQRALQTPVVVSKDGVVLSGNGRTMAGELAAQSGTDGAYIDYLKKYAHKYGFTPEQVEAMQHPRVSFVPDEAMPYTAETFSAFNQQEMKSLSKTEQSVKLGKTVPDDTFSKVVRTINAFDTLGDFYGDPEASYNAIAMLNDAGVIPQAQMAEMMDGHKLSAVGREVLENMLIGKSFASDPDAVRRLTAVPSMRQSVIFSLAEISNNLNLGGDYSLQQELNDAIKLCYEARTQGKYEFGDPVSSYARQLNLFAFDDEMQTVADINNATTLLLADVLNDKRVSQLKKTLVSYNNQSKDSASGQLDMFTGGVREREDILKDVLTFLNNGTKQEIDAAQQSAIERRKAEAASMEQTGNVEPGIEGNEQPTVETPAEVEQPTEETAKPTVQQSIETASAEVNTEPTDGQKEAGNYKMGHVKVDGYNITIENPKGSVRRGKDANGKEWETPMNNTYGYIRGTEGVDGDHIDVFLSDEPDKGDVFVVDQYNPDGTFDEHKVMYGFNTPEEARAAYLSNYSDGWENGRRLDISHVSKDEFKKWVDSSHRKTKAFADYARVQKETDSREPLPARNDGYTIEKRNDITKKGADGYAVNFTERVGRDEFKGQCEIAKQLGGWYSRGKGFVFKNEDAAHDFAETVMGRTVEEVEDEAPITINDISAMNGGENPTKVNVESLFDALRTDGEAKLSDHAEKPATEPEPAKAETEEEKTAHDDPDGEQETKTEEEPKQEKSKYVDDEDAERFEELRKRLHKKLYGQLNSGFDPETFAIGAEMAYLMLKKGARKLNEFAKSMIELMGDGVRPHIKSFYDGARHMMSADIQKEMSNHEEVDAFDALNFDKQGAKDIVATAEHIDTERKSAIVAAETEKQIKDKRNEEKRNKEQQIAADTEAIVNEAEAVASAIESELETDEAAKPDVLETFREKIIEQVNKVNDQLAVLGYYEADEVESDFNEAYGYMRNAEKKGGKKAKAVTEQTQIADLFGDFFDNPKSNNNEEVQLQSRPGETEREGGHEPRQNESLGKSEQPEAERPDGRGMDGRDAGNTEPDAERSGAVSGAVAEQSVESSPEAEATVAKKSRKPQPELPAEPQNTRNNHAERGVDYAPKGENARIEANLKAIETMKRLVENGEDATPEDMEVLRKFSGWGGLGAAFNTKATYSIGSRTTYGGPTPANKRLRALLSPEQYEAANMSRNSAYYTPAEVIESMWDVARALGFKGGNVLEGSAGIGNIIGLMPQDMSERSNIHAVEIDDVTGNILKLLYPDAKVEIQGFEKTAIPNGSVDLAITNVPFVTGLHVLDETGDKDLSKKFRDIHDFCIAKNVRKLREGGTGIFITSSGTLDNSQKLRNWLVNEGNADVVGAFRMHNKTFGGTGATSDIIVVRKRVNGQKSANAIDVSNVGVLRTVAYTDDNDKTKSLALDFNNYFIEHPENMAGEMRFGFEEGDTFRPTSKALYPSKNGNDQGQMLREWADGLSKMDWEAEKPTAEPTATVAYDIADALAEGQTVCEGEMFLNKNGELCVAQRATAVPLAVNANKVKGHTKAECFTAYKGIKDALAEVLDYQTAHDDDAGLQPLIDKLNKAYDAFVKTYGHLNKNTAISFLRNDMDYPSIAALESVTERGTKDGKREVTYGKTDIFSHRVVEKESEPKPTTVKDGIIASIYLNGRVDVPYIAEQLGMGEAEVKQQIIESGLGFENPVTNEMEVSYEYLSGNVREKLHQAKANNTDGRFDANVKALERVVPMNIPAHLIDFSLGSSWIEPKLYEDFVKERTGVDVSLRNIGGTWMMKEKESWRTGTEQNKAAGVRSEKLNMMVLGHELISAALQNKTITMSKTEKHYDGTTETVIDKEATQACANRIDEIRQDFKDWARGKMQGDSEMSQKMETVYNDQFNNYVPKSIPDEFVPEHFGGAARVVNGRPFQLRPHQAKAAIRATTQPLMLAHEVGTGKTYTLITTAMEMRRLGTARKPMIVVQNATVGQFVASAKALYPNAKILTLEDADRNVEGRKNFYAKIRYNDWDMIVVPQSVFERIPDSEERQAKFVEDKIEEKLLVLEQMKEAAGDNNSRDPNVRQAEKEIEKLRDELNDIRVSMTDRSDKQKEKDEKREAKTKQNAEVQAREMLDRAVDDVANFDDMGIDALLIDEAHEYKHLGFATAMQRGVKGVDPSYSKKSQGVYLKTQAVLENNNGRNVVFATGTPISNTAAEIWTFMRYLMTPEAMKDYGMYYFDDFVRNFGNIQNVLEFGASGKYKPVNRFLGYFNLPELVRIWAGVADTVLTREAGGVKDKIPEMEGGQAQDVFLPQTRALRGVMKFVKQQLEDFENMSGKEKKENSHIPLVMFGIAKAAAVDVRLVESDAPDEPNSKTNETVRQTLRSLKETADYKGTVAIFADNYQNKHSGFNLYEDIRAKLIAAGVPDEQIVVMKSGMTVKKKLEIFDRVNRGEVRVVMGSTFTLGTGVNIQERLHTLIHVDAPNRPMDYTQRNGRILRQGNMHRDWNKPVRVLRFGVEDSLDVTAYQRLKTKGAIADSIMEGKKMISNSMENRSLEEEQDIFGDITAQLSGSQYALLKNQMEKEVRNLESKFKQWQMQQTYIHNQKPTLGGQIRTTEERVASDREALAKLNEAGLGEKISENGMPTIKAGKHEFSGLEAMGDYIKEFNKKQTEIQDAVRASHNYDEKQTRTLVINVGGIDFVVNSTISKFMNRNGADLFASAQTKMTYSCPELGLEEIPVNGQRLKAALEDILNNVVTGKDLRERIERANDNIERYKSELAMLESQEGKPFTEDEKLKAAKEKLAEYDALMQKEMEEKEAKYAEVDAEVEAATGVELSDEEDGDTNVEGKANGGKVSFRIREDEPPTNTGTGYKVFVLKDGKLYPPMVANPNGEATPTGVWLDADAAPVAGESKTGRLQVAAGGKGTQGGSGKLAYRPGWHLGEIPYALQFNRLNPETGERELFPNNFVWAEVDYANDVDYQDEAMSYGMNANGKFQHSLAGLPRLPLNGSYRYRTNPNPDTDPWIITGAMRVKRILKPSEVDAMVEAAGREPQERQAGAVTDEMVEALNKDLSRRMNTEPEAIRQEANMLAKKYGVKVTMVEDVEKLGDNTAENDTLEKMKKAKGWYDHKTGEIVVVMPNNRDVEDISATMLHETVAHKGLRELVGEDNYTDFLHEVFEHCNNTTRKKIADKAAKYGWDFDKATDEYLGDLSEKGFEDFDEGDRGIWQKLKDIVLKAIDKFLKSLKLPKWVKLGDNELRYMLWRSHKNLQRGKEGVIEQAQDIVMREDLKLGELSFRDPGETGDIWSDASMGFAERMTAAATRLSNNHQGDKQLKTDAMRAIGGNLADIRKAMSLQRTFDMTTVKRVGDLARILMDNGFLNDLNQQEVKRLLAAVKNSVGHETIDSSIQKVMDIMIDNQLHNAKETLNSLVTIKGSKVDAKGVEVQGQLDPDGARTMQVFKKAYKLPEDDINQRISEALNRMSSTDNAVADEAAIEYTGLNLALDYVQNIAASVAEEKALRDDMKLHADGASSRDKATDSYRQYVASMEDAIRQNKTERVEAYYQLVGRMSDALRESLANAADFREAEKQRVREIQHNANSDMQGRPSDEHHKVTWKEKFVNNSFVQLGFAPLATFDQMLRMFGSKSANGEGYLWNRFMRGWVDAREKEITGVKAKYAILDEKAAEVFRGTKSHGTVRSWGDLIRMERKMPKASVSFWNGGEMQERELTQGNLLYIYMVNKMLDGRIKLRKMGITERDIDNIVDALDPRFLQLADWLQDEFLVNTRNEYNETHKRMFGASMAAIENYFPLKILANARADKPEDLDNPHEGEGISTTTGSIIKRRRNALALDITGADAFSVILDHVAQMEHWNAFAEWNRDLNTLRTYRHFRNQVQNMTSVYGGGKELWKKFNDVCQMAAGSYRPPRAKLDEAAVNFAKGVTAAKVSFRVFTALKQFLSAPAYIPEVNFIDGFRNPAEPFGWCLENLPVFKERWQSRMSGDPRLLKSDMDWKMWRSRIIELSSRVGMSPNAFVDAITISIGAKGIYETRKAQYLKDGYSDEEADRRAKQDATILFNETQQSSEGPFTSTMQVDRSWLSVLFTVFRNASMSYQRQLHDALRNMRRNVNPSNYAETIAFMKKQIERDGIDSTAAQSAAERKFKRQLLKDVLRIATFGYIMQFAWNLGAYLPYILFGDDEDEKGKMWDDVWTHTMFGSIEGLTGGDVMSQAGNMLVSGEGNPAYLTKDMPLASDITEALKKLGNGKKAEAFTDLVNIIVQSGIGVNPQSITDTALAIMDACGDDPELAHEAAICVMRILQVPQSQIDKMYFDEVGLSGEEVSQYTPAQLAERYARYKVKRGNIYSPWSWNDDEALGKHTKKADTTIKERLGRLGSEEVNEAYSQFAESTKELQKVETAFNKAKKTDLVEAARLAQELQSDPVAFKQYKTFKALDSKFDKIVGFYLNAQTAEEANLCKQAVVDFKTGMVKVLQSDGPEQQEAIASLTQTMNAFVQDLGKMRPGSSNANGMQVNQ